MSKASNTVTIAFTTAVILRAGTNALTYWQLSNVSGNIASQALNQ